ncbi:MAG TPA: transglycosylase domain-containing protein [Burkholderiaceae bacterium]|nr:transglycosylase domain-containing protein [Burkholderiaceae bacterium]
MTSRERTLARWRGVGRAALASLAVLLFAASLYVLILIPLTPSVEGVLNGRDERPSVLLAGDGTVLTTFRRTNREWIKLDQVPRHVVDALIATEDHRFWEHNGVDWVRSLSAIGHTVIGERQGGSTLTQQLARNYFPDQIGRAPTLNRKLKEMITAIKLERAYSKREILESYFNTVSFHYNATGLEMAARTYFDKPATELNVLEGATLIGMLKGTSTYNPVLNPERARERRNVVLAQMVKMGKLSAATYATLRERPLKLDFARQDLDLGPAPHFAEAVRRWLAEWAGERGYNIYADGLVVQSTLDLRLQQRANQAVARQLEALQAVADVEWGSAGKKLLSTRLDAYRQAHRRTEPFRYFWASHPDLIEAFVRESPEFARLTDPAGAKPLDAAAALAQLRADRAFMDALRARKTRLEAGLVALEPATGKVRAWVGSRDFAADRFDHVQQAHRQPGSTFKPFVYGAALEAGFDPQRQFADKPVAIRMSNGDVWRPGDMGGSTGRMLTFEDGLVYSRNTVTAQVMDELGPRKVVQFAQKAGVRESPLDAVPSLALGTSPVTLLEMASAYGTIAAQGEYHPPVLVTRVTDATGALIADLESRRDAPAKSEPAADTREPLPAGPERVMDQELAVQLIDMLRGVVDRGTGRGIREIYDIRGDVAGKTGTTQNNTDGWFVLMHPQLVTGVWVGFDDARVTLRSDYWGQGANNALYVVGDFMSQALASGTLDPNASFPSRFGAHFAAALRRFGDRIRSWLGFSTQ